MTLQASGDVPPNGPITPNQFRNLPVGSLAQVTAWGVTYTLLRADTHTSHIERIGTYQVRGGTEWTGAASWGHDHVLLHAGGSRCAATTNANLLELVDEIEGVEVMVNNQGVGIWIHTTDQVKEWLTRALTTPAVAENDDDLESQE